MKRITDGDLPGERELTSASDNIADTIWDLSCRCWAREPRKRPTCEDVVQELRSKGITREDEPGTDECTMDTRRKFLEAMRKNEDVPIDLNAVGQIFDEVRCSRFLGPACSDSKGLIDL